MSWRQRRRELYRRRPKFAGPPVVLLHAGGMDGRMWHPVVERLEDRYWLIVPDMRGHGTTPMPAAPYSDVEDILGVLDDLEIEQAAFAGNSFGGRVALQLATAAPERYRGVDLTGLDVADFAKIADRIAAEVPGAQRAEVADSGHLIPLERPDTTVELLEGFLSGGRIEPDG